jgi:transposase
MLQKEQWMRIHVLKAQGLSLREIARHLYAFTATLGFSRWRWARFATNEKAETLIACQWAGHLKLGETDAHPIGAMTKHRQRGSL